LNNLDQIIKLATSIRKKAEEVCAYPRLDGWCGLTAKYITLLAETQGLHPTLVGGFFKDWPHCWIEYYGKIIDITATQFSHDVPNVLITHNKDERYMQTRGWGMKKQKDSYPYTKEFHIDWLPIGEAKRLHVGRKGKLIDNGGEFVFRIS